MNNESPSSNQSGQNIFANTLSRFSLVSKILGGALILLLLIMLFALPEKMSVSSELLLAITFGLIIGSLIYCLINELNMNIDWITERLGKWGTKPGVAGISAMTGLLGSLMLMPPFGEVSSNEPVAGTQTITTTQATQTTTAPASPSEPVTLVTSQIDNSHVTTVLQPNRVSELEKNLQPGQVVPPPASAAPQHEVLQLPGVPASSTITTSTASEAQPTATESSPAETSSPSSSGGVINLSNESAPQSVTTPQPSTEDNLPEATNTSAPASVVTTDSAATASSSTPTVAPAAVSAEIEDQLKKNDGLIASKQYTDALKVAQDVVQKLQNVPGSESTLITALVQMGKVNLALGKFSDAEEPLKKALDTAKKTKGPESLETASVELELGELYRWSMRHSEAEPLLKHALEASQKVLPADDDKLIEMMVAMGNLYRAQQRVAEAEPLLKKALAIQEVKYGKESKEIVPILEILAQIYTLDENMYAESEWLNSRIRRILGLPTPAQQKEMERGRIHH